MRKAKNKKLGNARTHGMRYTRIYSIWTNLTTRITNKKVLSYSSYGGRGIKCLWQNFEEFYRDMGPTYKEGLSIERKDVNGHYCKENCEWIPFKEQASNTRKNVKFKGETMAQAERRLGLKRGTLWMRIRNGWKMKRAFLATKYENRIYQPSKNY